jgi:hypothetical protein
MAHDRSCGAQERSGLDHDKTLPLHHHHSVMHSRPDPASIILHIVVPVLIHRPRDLALPASPTPS